MVAALFTYSFLALSANQTKVEYALEKDISYRQDQNDAEIKSQCKLDLYYPKNAKHFATIVWFHGGSLTAGGKEIPEALKRQGVAVVGVGYRLSPKVKVAQCIEDAAAATAWVVKNIESKGGDPKKLFISGHSAGGYLASMITLDKNWLKPYQVDPDTFAGLVPFSGQAITHFTARKERGIPERQPIIDDMAPIYYVRKDAPPILLLSGDRNMELYGRYEESAYFWRMLKEVGHPDVQLLEFQGYDHGGMPAPGFPVMLRFIREHTKKADSQ